MTAEEVDDRVRKAVALVSTAEQLAPYDPTTFNAALLIWRDIAGIPAQHRHRLLSELNSSDIKRLWRLSRRRLVASKDEARTVLGSFRVRDDLPQEPGEVVVFDGKAALPVHSLGVSAFSKAFFLSPRDYRLYGRVLLRRGPLGDWLYPLYYRVNPQQIAIPGTGDIADLSLDYLAPQQLDLQPDDLPIRSWPSPREHLYPFSCALTDYLRPVGPGVYVGVGYKEARPGQDLGPRFLYFLLVKRWQQ